MNQANNLQRSYIQRVKYKENSRIQNKSEYYSMTKRQVTITNVLIDHNTMFITVYVLNVYTTNRRL